MGRLEQSMQKQAMFEFIVRTLEESAAGHGYRYYKKPENIFMERFDRGEYDDLSRTDIMKKKDEYRKMSECFWVPYDRDRKVRKILEKIIEVSAPDYNDIEEIASILMKNIERRYNRLFEAEDGDDEEIPLEYSEDYELDDACERADWTRVKYGHRFDDIWDEGKNEDEDDDDFDEDIDDFWDDDETVSTDDDPADKVKEETEDTTENTTTEEQDTDILDPKEIYAMLDKKVCEQKEAKEAASMLLWEQMNGIKSNMVFIGPTGCGKTEIFRQLKKIYSDIYIIDASAITQDGWKGSFKITDIFRNIGDVKKIERSIMVMDEADKMFEPQTTASGENVSYSVQNELLKIIEGEELHIDDMVIDTSKISFVFMGAFESLLSKKREVSGGIGFGKEVGKDDVTYDDDFTLSDLVEYAGVRREIAGRISAIVQLRPMTAKSYFQILNTPEMSPISQVSELFHRRIEISDFAKYELAKEAADSGMGVRYMYSKIKQMMEKQIFEYDNREAYRLSC